MMEWQFPSEFNFSLLVKVSVFTQFFKLIPHISKQIQDNYQVDSTLTLFINSFCTKINTFTHLQLQDICRALDILLSNLSFAEWKKWGATHLQIIQDGDLDTNSSTGKSFCYEFLYIIFKNYMRNTPVV